MKRLVGQLAGLASLFLFLLGASVAAQPPTPATWHDEVHTTATTWYRTARLSWLDASVSVSVWEEGETTAPARCTARGYYQAYTSQYRIVGSYEQWQHWPIVQRVYREEYIDSYYQRGERTWAVTAREREGTALPILSILYGRPSLPEPPALVRRAQTAPQRVRLLVRAWAGARHQVQTMQAYLTATGSGSPPTAIPWVAWAYAGSASARWRAALPGVNLNAAAPAPAARYVGAVALRVDVPPNLPLRWRSHRGPLPGLSVVNTVPLNRVAPPALPVLGTWRLTLAVVGDVYAVGELYEVCLLPHVDLLLAWWELTPLGSWEPRTGIWGRFLAQNGALREWGLERTAGVAWSSDWAMLVQRNRLSERRVITGWRCASNPLAQAR